MNLEEKVTDKQLLDAINKMISYEGNSNSALANLEGKSKMEMLARHYPNIYKQYQTGTPLEKIFQKYPKVGKKYWSGEIGEDDIDF